MGGPGAGRGVHPVLDAKDGGVMPGVFPRVSSLLRGSPLLVCVAVGIGACGPDIDHVVEGFARQTHVMVMLASWVCVGVYLARCSRLARTRILTKEAVQ